MMVGFAWLVAVGLLSWVHQVRSWKFSVWAPNARSVAVMPIQTRGGEIAHWNMTSLKQHHEDWQAEVLGVRPGDCYVFVINDGLLRIDPRAADIKENALGNVTCSIVPKSYEWNTNRVLVPLERAVIYELHLPSFSEAGTFEGATEKLDHLTHLGINVIELLPIATHNKQSNWGYDPMAPWAVEPSYGGSEGLKRFVDAASRRGMAVALDIVWNHVHVDTYLKNYDGPEDIYFYTDQRRETPWGIRPRFDGRAGEYILDSLRYYIEEFHISGFRWDIIKCVRSYGGSLCNGTDIPEGYLLLQRANEMLHSPPYDNTLSFAEDMSG